MISGIGGGLGRDVLTGEIPIVLRREIYAVASLFGGAVVLTPQWADVPRAASVTVTAFIVFAIRIVSLHRHWSAPTPRIVAPGAVVAPAPTLGAVVPPAPVTGGAVASEPAADASEPPRGG
jgi:Glycine transporter